MAAQARRAGRRRIAGDVDVVLDTDWQPGDRRRARVHRRRGPPHGLLVLLGIGVQHRPAGLPVQQLVDIFPRADLARGQLRQRLEGGKLMERLDVG